MKIDKRRVYRWGQGGARVRPVEPNPWLGGWWFRLIEDGETYHKGEEVTLDGFAMGQLRLVRPRR